MCTKLNFYSTWPQSFANLISHIGSTKKMGRATVLIWIIKDRSHRVLIRPHASLGYRRYRGCLCMLPFVRLRYADRLRKRR